MAFNVWRENTEDNYILKVGNVKTPIWEQISTVYLKWWSTDITLTDSNIYVCILKYLEQPLRELYKVISSKTLKIDQNVVKNVQITPRKVETGNKNGERRKQRKQTIQHKTVDLNLSVSIMTVSPYQFQFQFSCSLVDNFLRPHGLQHARLPCPYQFPELAKTHVHWVGDAIQPSHPLSSPTPLAFNPSQYQGLFQWVGSSHQVAKVLEFQLQHQSFQWVFRISL